MPHPVFDCRLLDVGLEAGVYEPRPAEGTDVGDDDVLSLVVRLKQTFQAVLRYVLQSFDAAGTAHSGPTCKSARDNKVCFVEEEVVFNDLVNYIIHIFVGHCL